MHQYEARESTKKERRGTREGKVEVEFNYLSAITRPSFSMPHPASVLMKLTFQLTLIEMILKLLHCSSAKVGL